MFNQQLADARAEIERLQSQVTRLQTEGTAELLKYRKKLAARDARILELEGLLSAAVSVARDGCGQWNADNDMRARKILKALSGWLPGYRTDTDAIHAALAGKEVSRG